MRIVLFIDTLNRFINKLPHFFFEYREKMGQFIDKAIESINKQNNAHDKLLVLIKMHFKQLAEDHSLAVVTQLELRQSKIDLRIQINGILKPYLTVIDTIIMEGIQEGIYQKDLNTPLVRQMIFGTMDEIVTNWVMKEHRYDLMEQAPGVHSLLTTGLTVNK